nr:hypothetical protein [Ornithinicoccus soli]
MGQVDHQGVGQHSGNSRIGLGNSVGALAGSLLGRGAGQVHRVGDLVEPVVEQVTVGVHGHRRRGVAEHVLDDLDIGTGRDRQARGGVPQLVRMQAGKSDRPRGRIEAAAAEDRRPHRAAAPDPGEDQLVGCLAGDVRGQVLDQEPGNRDVAALMGLRGPPHQPLALDHGDRLGDQGTPAHQVEPADRQRRHLAEPDAGVGQEQHHEPVGLVGALVEPPVLAHLRWPAALGGERRHLRVAQVALLLPHRPGQVHSLGDVARQPSVPDSHVQDQGEDAMNLPDRRRGPGRRQGGHPGLHVGVGDVGQGDVLPLRPDVLAHDAGVPLPGGRLEVGLVLQPVGGQLAHGQPRQDRVDERAGLLRGLDGGQEALRVELAVERLVALRAGRGAVVRPPGDLSVAEALLDAGHGSLSPRPPTGAEPHGRSCGSWDSCSSHARTSVRQYRTDRPIRKLCGPVPR